MVKLFWNTHNQISPTSNDPKKEDVLNYKWGVYHKDNSDEWINFILKRIKFKVIEKTEELENGDIVIIVDSSVEKKSELYTKLRLICSKVFLIHLGDEGGSFNLTSIYDNCDFIWRAFCSNKYFNNSRVNCLPIGYKSGLLNKNINQRKYKWAFVGTPHKSSRHDLLFQFSNIKPFFCHKTQKFDQKIISVEEMSDVLSSTEFMPCPNGFYHPETYRLYEALECECIPIVEDAYSYYDRLFPNNPFIKINKWTDAKPILNGWEKKQILKKQEECKNWWQEYKRKMQESINSKITS